MPDLPDITVYVERAQERLQGQVLRRLRLLNPFVLRTAEPPIASAEGLQVVGVERLGKRVVLALQGDGGDAAAMGAGAGAQKLWLVIHLMIAGRLRWLVPGGTSAKLPGRISLAALDFDAGTLLLTEAGTQRRAALHCVGSREALVALDAGGLDIFSIDSATFNARLRSENHTLKRALTDPRLFSGIGNAYSDEILHRARLSPLALSANLPEADTLRLFEAARGVLLEWTARLRAQAPQWPDKVTAFHAEMAVHGRYGQPCPVCSSPVQRIVYASNESNYCARCQTGGKLLADRALSRLLKASWPKSIDDL